jgi:hypothetical protein
MSEETSERISEFVMKNFMVSLVFFATGAFLGFFLTAFIPMSPTSWPYVVYARIIWQFGGAAWLGASIAFMFGGSFAGRVICFLVCALVGAVLSLNPLRDVIENGGPIHLVDARLEGFEVDDVSLKNQVKGIVADVRLRDPGGATFDLGTRGLQANRYQWAFDDCEARGWTKADPVEIIAFEHLGNLLKLDCGVE